MPKDKIKKIFSNYMYQVLLGMLDDPRDFHCKTTNYDYIDNIHGFVMDMTVFDIYDTKDDYYGSIVLEVKYDGNSVTDVVTYAQVYNEPQALEFDDLEECIYDMIDRKDKSKYIYSY